MTFSENDVVYCDANFLIAYGARKVKQPELKKRALVLFAQVLIGKCKIIVSSLTFDEVWMGIKREIDPKSVKSRWRIKANDLLQRVGLKLMNSGVENFSYSDSEIFNDLESFTNKLLGCDNFAVVQFDNPKNGVVCALENMNNFNLKPRDSFHVAFAKNNQATYILTNDSDICKKKDKIEVNIINF